MTEEVLYEEGTVKITPARVVSGGTTYAVANITSVKAVKDNKIRMYGIAAAAFGVVLIARETLGIGLVLIVVGILMAVYGGFTEVQITTGAAEQQAFRSRSEKLALAVASAINLAIMKRSAMFGR